MKYAMLVLTVAALLVAGCEAVKQTGAEAGKDLGTAFNQTSGQVKESEQQVTTAPDQLKQAGSDAQGTVETQAAGAKEQVSGKQKILGTEALKALLDAKTPIVVVDARTGKFDDGKRIPGAKTLSPEATEEEIAQTVGEVKSFHIVTYCAGPTCPASGKLAEKLRTLGYTNVMQYEAGMPGWETAGMPVAKVEIKAVGAPIGK